MYKHILAPVDLGEGRMLPDFEKALIGPRQDRSHKTGRPDQGSGL